MALQIIGTLVAGKKPLPSEIAERELAVNLVDGRLWTKNDQNVVIEVATQADLNVENNLTTVSTGSALDAAQGKVLKGMIDNINSLLASDDVNLDEVQEIVDFIKSNKTTLDSLGISSIMGLDTALAGKLGKTENAVSASKLATARTIALSGAVTGSTAFDGSGNVTIATTATADPTITLAGDLTGNVTLTNLGNGTLTASVKDDSHNHVITNVDGLSAALAGKVDDSQVLTDVPAGAVFTDTVYNSSAVDSHMADASKHFTMGSISITEAQISNLGNYENAFSKNSGFNKNIGTTAGTVAEGNHEHDAGYFVGEDA